MTEVLKSYSQFEEWVQSQSRSVFAILIGIASAIGVLVASFLSNDIGIQSAVWMGIMTTVVYYVFKPLSRG